MTDTPTYVVTAALPSLTITWKENGQLVLLATGHTFELRVALNGTTLLAKTSGISGADIAPNVTIDWATGELANLTPNKTHSAQLIATRTSDGKPRIFPFALQMLAAIPAPSA